MYKCLLYNTEKPFPSRGFEIDSLSDNVIIGNSMKCQSCVYSTPEEKQKCTKTVECSTDYCYASNVTRKNEMKLRVKLGCVKQTAYCDFPGVTCDDLIKVDNLKSCHFQCCRGNMCNGNGHGDDPYGGATVVMGTKFALSLIVMTGFLFT